MGMRRRGFTIVELGVVVVIVVTLGAMALIVLSQQRPRSGPREMRDSAQVRGIHQVFVMWAQNNADEYPLPSKVDVKNATVAEEGRAKDTTANIMSMMVFNGSITPEMLVSPSEVNRSIRVYQEFEYERPRRAVRPEDALWDPGLSANFTSESTGHVSYAHLLPAEHRLAKWVMTYEATDPVVGNRGPEVTGVAWEADGLIVPRYANARSNTFRLHGTRDHWVGNIAFGDGHVEFRLQPFVERRTDTGMERVTYKNTAGEEVQDVLFYDEPDDSTGLNHYLGIFIKAGEKREEFEAIWD